MGKSKDLATGNSTAYVETAGDTMSGALTVDATAATVLTVDRATSDGSIIDVQKDGTSVGSIRSLSGDITIDGPSEHTGLRFEAADITPRHNGSASNNYTNLGTASSRYKNLFLGGGVYLGGTGEANKIEDYEEGTFTPSFVTGGTLSVNNAKYIKIGRLCYVGFYIHNIANIPNNGSLAEITGFPFANSNTTNQYHGVGTISYVSSANWTQYDILGPTPRQGSNSCYFHHGGGTAAGMSNSNFRILNGHQLIFALVYQTD